MDRERILEISVGIFVAAGLAALLVLALQVSNLSSLGDNDGYNVSASFENIGGLKVRSPVTVSGVKVGRVVAINYDNDNFEAVVMMEINEHFSQFPIDTSAMIYTSGLLGEQYIALEPGGADDVLVNGSHLSMTQSAIVLEKMIGQFMFNQAGDN